MRNFAHILSFATVVLMCLITWLICYVGDYLNSLGGYFEYAAVLLSWLGGAMWIGAIYIIAYLQVHRNVKEAKF